VEAILLTVNKLAIGPPSFPFAHLLHGGDLKQRKHRVFHWRV